MPDRILFYPEDFRLRALEEADAYFRGRFRFGTETIDIDQGSIFDRAPETAAFSAGLHGFEWLRHLEQAGSEIARNFALKLAQQWLRRNARVNYPAWNPEFIAARLFNIFAHGRFFLVNSDLVWRSRLFVSLRNQTRVLARTLKEAPAGAPRLSAAASLALGGLCLGDRRIAVLGLKALREQIEAQILPDGGHVSRSPEQLLDVYRVLLAVQSALDHGRHQTEPALRSAIDRIAPMLRFFRLGDGGLATFHGGAETDARILTAALHHDETQGRPLGHAPYSAFQRLASARTAVLLDVGCEPDPDYSTAAHASALAFEMSSGGQRVIVGCGPQAAADQRWAGPLRSTAAHSTLTLADTSSAMVLEGRVATILGPRLIRGPVQVDTRRSDGSQGVTVEAEHDGYAERFGLIHWRRLTLARRGLALVGADRLLPAASGTRRKDVVPFAVRFHIHPDVRTSVAQGGSVLLKLPNGDGWRFRCGGAPIAVEESIYFGGGAPRRSEQLVISGAYRGEAMECAWVLEHAGAQ